MPIADRDEVQALVDALARTHAVDSIRRVVEDHAQPTDAIPRDGEALRAFARAIEPTRGRAVLDALLADLARFDAEDDDSDFGWIRGETLRWERWAHERARADLDEAVDVGALRSVRDRSAARRALAMPASGADEEESLDAIHRATRLALALDAAGEPAAARVFAVTGLALEHACEESRTFAISDARTAIAAEEVTPLTALIAATPTELRGLVTTLAEAEDASVGGRVRDLLGRGDATERAGAIVDLRTKRDRARSEDTRFPIDLELLLHYGDDLAPNEVLDLCRRLDVPDAAVARLLAWGRVDEAARWADEALAGEDIVIHRARNIAAAFLTGGEPGRAAAILKSRADGDLEASELLVRALAAIASPDLAAAARAWFALRPTAATYRSVLALAPDSREDLLAHLDAKKLHSTLLDIAAVEDDIATIDATIAVIDPRLLDHARATLGPVLDRLAPSTRDRLAPAPAPPAAALGVPNLASPPESEPAAPRFVTHPRFGRGEVKRVEGHGEAAKLTIAFDDHGEKTLVARFVRPL